MKEITRIHIAKTPYDIELAAKKDLETYMKSLETYSDDQEIIEDVEIRITEILAERGVKKDGVVSVDDVEALKKQLGDPREFMGEGDIAVGPEENEEPSGDVTRKLYRDVDHRVLGGVLSGIAAFFKINPLWVRLLFVIVALASFGTALLVYIVLWIAVPPARTATDKLQMAGRPVTVHSIRELNESEAGRSDTDNQTTQRVVTMLLGVGFVIGAAVAAAITVAGALGVALNRRPLFDVVLHSTPFVVAYILALVSGMLLVVMFILAAYASFAQKITKRVLISLCVVVVLGLVSFGTAIGLVQYGSLQLRQTIIANTREKNLTLPANVQNATAIEVDSGEASVQYIVSQNMPSATLRAVAQNDSTLPKVDFSLQNGVLKVKVTEKNEEKCNAIWGCNHEPTVIIYGPMLSKATADENASLEYHAADQQSFTMTARRNAQATIATGSVDTLNVVADEDATVDMTAATVRHLQVAAKTAATIDAGTIQSLAATGPDICPSHAQEMRINVWRIVEENMLLNGATRPSHMFSSDCMKINIEGEND